MTPLAHAIVSDTTLPLRSRRYGDAAQRLGMLDGLHFFEVSAVIDLANDMAPSIRKSGPASKVSFLPAARVWMEYRQSGGRRMAVLLETSADKKMADGTIILCHQDGEIEVGDIAFQIPLLSGADGSYNRVKSAWSGAEDGGAICDYFVSFVYALLAMINTPRIIGRRQHMPHAGLQRNLAKARGMVGKYPLHAWHEVVLEVRPTIIDEGQPHEDHITGRKAFHFCRAHLRVRLGCLEYVSAHWRGDPALGIKQTRYRLKGPKPPEGPRA